MHALHFLLSFKSGERVTIFSFLHPILRVIPPNVLGIGQSYFVYPQTVLQISIPFQRSSIGQQASCLLFTLRGIQDSRTLVS